MKLINGRLAPFILALLGLIPLLASCGTGGGSGGSQAAVVIGKVELTAGADQLIADGLSQVRITAEVLDTNGNRVPDGKTVTFTVTSGDIDKDQAGTQSTFTASTSAGFAYAYLTSPVRIGVCTITGTSDGVSGTVQVTFIPGPVTSISLSPSPASLVADGVSQSKILLKALDANGNEISGEVVTISLAAGTGSLSSATVTTAQGGVEVVYTASTTIGIETVKAEATNGVVATVDIALVRAVVGSIVLTAKSQTLMAGGTSSTEITALVNDDNGNPITSPTVVSFATTAGLLSASNATTSAGKASVNLISATRIGFATVTATAGGASASVTVTFIAGPVSAIALTANPNNLSADGKSTSVIRAQVTDAHGNAVADGEVISFSITAGLGTLSSTTASTSGGVATVTYTASRTPGTVTIRAGSTNGNLATVNITLIQATVGSVEVSIGAESLVADGLSVALVTALVKDTAGNEIADGTTVSFSTTAGTLSSPSAPTTNGVAKVNIISPTVVGVATVTATAGGFSATATVTFIPGSVSALALTANPNNLSADGKSTSVIRAQVTDSQGNAVADGEVISFSITSGGGTLSAPTAETKGGVASIIYTASNQEGSATIRATATNATSATTTITLIRASVGSITVSALSSSITANGTSNTTIRAVVKDTSGNNIADGTIVSFTTSAGSLSAPTATTTNGVASVTLFSATIVGSATVTAAAGGATATAAVQFVPGPVSTLTLSAFPNNIRADGASQSTLRAFAADAHGNAVADGEVISFNIQAGGTGTLSSPTASTSGGAASITYTASQTPGTVTVVARATNAVSASTSIIMIAAIVGSVEVTAGSDTLPADGTSQTQIRALVKDSNGQNIADGTIVSFTTTAGTLSSSTATTAAGIASVSLRSSNIAGRAVVRAFAGGIGGETEVRFVTGPITSITMTAEPNNLTADGKSTSKITALARDSRGNPAADGETINFSLSGAGGSLSSATATTTGGYASVTYTVSQVPGIAYISATHTAGATGLTSVTVIAAAVKTVTVTAGSASIPANGSSTTVIAAEVKDTNGNNVADGTIVNFTTTHGVFTSTGNTSATASTGGGIANVILRSSTIAATAKVKATAGGISGETTVVFAAVSDVLSLSTSQTSVKSDNSDSATITATVLDANKVPVSGVTVLFSASGGQISATSVDTDANGQAKILFSSGTVEKKNQTVTITATVAGLASRQIPIQITGTTITLTTDITNLEVGGSAATLTATLTDAGGVAIFDADMAFTVASASTGTVSLSQSSSKTDVAGRVTVTVTGTGAGAVTVKAESLGASATVAYTVSVTGQSFSIIAPGQDPYSMRTRAAAAITGPSTQIAFIDSNPDTVTRSDGGNFITDGFTVGDQIMVGGSALNDGVYTVTAVVADKLTVSENLVNEPAGANVIITNSVLVTVRAPTQANVQFATTFGGWDNTANLVISKLVTAQRAYAVLSSPNAGVAGVQVSDAANPAVSDTMTVVFSAPSSEASQLALQASATVVAPSTGSTKHTVTLTATVKNASAQVVGGAPVSFSLINPTGGGESISPVIVYTNDFGVAQSTFTSGALSSGGQGVTVRAEIVGSPAIFDQVQIIIGGTAGSVVIGRSTKIESVQNNTAYKLPMSVLVLDSNGNPVSGAIVTLGTWPTRYAVGGWAINGTPPPPCIPTANYTAPSVTSTLIAFNDNDPSADTITRSDGGSFISDGFMPGDVITVAGSTFNNGNYTVSNVSAVTLTLFPFDSLTTEAAGDLVTISSGSDVYPNEDANRNLILDAGEDSNADGELTPPNSAAGSVPATVTTDENGIGNFNLIYLKAHAAWIETEITADVLVLGTETRSTLTFWLPFAEDDACDLPPSPFTAP